MGWGVVGGVLDGGVARSYNSLSGQLQQQQQRWQQSMRPAAADFGAALLLFGWAHCMCVSFVKYLFLKMLDLYSVYVR